AVVGREDPQLVGRLGRALLEGVVDRFQAQAAAVVGTEVVGAVAGGVDRGIRGTAVLIDADAVVALEPGAGGELVPWGHPDRDDDDVGRILPPPPGNHPPTPPPTPGDRRTRPFPPDPPPLPAAAGLEQPA